MQALSVGENGTHAVQKVNALPAFVKVSDGIFVSHMVRLHTPSLHTILNDAYVLFLFTLSKLYTSCSSHFASFCSLTKYYYFLFVALHEQKMLVA